MVEKLRHLDPELAVIILTGVSSDDHDVRRLREDGIAVLHQPVQLAQLHTIVAEVLRRLNPWRSHRRRDCHSLPGPTPRLPRAHQRYGERGMPRSRRSGVAGDIRRLIEERHPSHCCDGCLALHFAVSLAEARSAALTVASESGFRRQHAVCGSCNRQLELTALAIGLGPN